MTASSLVAQQLMQLPLCQGLTEAEAAVVSGICEEASIRAGHTLFREGEPGDAIYAVLDGDLEVVKAHGDAAQVLARVGPGAVLGEMSLLGANAQRSATVVATSDARLLKIPAAQFSRLIERDDVAALKVVLNVARVMSSRLQKANEKMMELASKAQRKEELLDFQKILSHWAF